MNCPCSSSTIVPLHLNCIFHIFNRSIISKSSGKWTWVNGLPLLSTNLQMTDITLRMYDENSVMDNIDRSVSKHGQPKSHKWVPLTPGYFMCKRCSCRRNNRHVRGGVHPTQCSPNANQYIRYLQIKHAELRDRYLQLSNSHHCSHLMGPWVPDDVPNATAYCMKCKMYVRSNLHY